MIHSKRNLQESNSSSEELSPRAEMHELDIDMSRADWLADVEEAVTKKTPDPFARRANKSAEDKSAEDYG